MIRTNGEYREATRRFKEDLQFIEAQKKAFVEQGFGGIELERLMDPILSFHKQLEEEITWYENISRGQVAPINRLTQIGRTIIGLRIRKGWTQKEMAENLCVSESQVSRDERNEYHGLTIERAQKIFDVLGVRFTGNAETEENISELMPDDQPDQSPPQLTIV